MGGKFSTFLRPRLAFVIKSREELIAIHKIFFKLGHSVRQEMPAGTPLPEKGK